MPSFKHNRTAEDIRREITLLIRELKDPRVKDKMLTVVRVEVSADASFAKVYVSFIGATNRKEALAALERAKGFIRSELSQRLDIRRCPDLIFEIDKAEENARHIDAIIDEIHKNDSNEEE